MTIRSAIVHQTGLVLADDALPVRSVVGGPHEAFYIPQHAHGARCRRCPHRSVQVGRFTGHQIDVAFDQRPRPVRDEGAIGAVGNDVAHNMRHYPTENARMTLGGAVEQVVVQGEIEAGCRLPVMFKFAGIAGLVFAASGPTGKRPEQHDLVVLGKAVMADRDPRALWHRFRGAGSDVDEAIFRTGAHRCA